jgi:hypothetical protein
MNAFAPFPIRTECPPGACVCERERLLADPQADIRILRLTKIEEKKLVERIEAVTSLDELRQLEQRMQELLGLEIRISPGANEVRSVRGFKIEVLQRPGLCIKTRQAIPAAVRRCLEAHPGIAWDILNSHDLLGSV